MRHVWNRYGTLLALGVLLLAAACGSARRGAPVANVPAITDPQVAMGQQAFDRHCHACHPGGTAGLGPALNDKPLPGFVIRFQVRHGLGAMPSFTDEELPDAELDAVVAYMRWLRARQPDPARLRPDGDA